MEYQRIDLEKTEIRPQLCITEDVRLSQVTSNVARGLSSLKEFKEPSDEPIAIVGFGPSLNDTWKDIRQFKTIFTCSGSHKFLLDKELRPEMFKNWYHVEVDPQSHKVGMLGIPQKGIHYLISSNCHPLLFDLLDEYDVNIWHLYDTTRLRDLPTMYPRGDIVITGGSNVGLRVLVLARVLGYKNQHIFGMDYSFSNIDNTHADFHPKFKPEMVKPFRVELEDKTYITTAPMVHYAREFWHELESLPDVIAILHGEGMLQHWARIKMNNGGLQLAEASVIAVQIPEVISEEYRQLNIQLHESNSEYGSYGYKYADIVRQLKEKSNVNTVLDYGCGKGTLAKNLPFEISEYDPAIPGKDKEPISSDMVVCTDVLEHIEPDYLDTVIGDLARCTLMVCFLVINTRPSSKTLADGRNAHLIQHEKCWWYWKLKQHFDLEMDSIRKVDVIDRNGILIKDAELHILCIPKKTPEFSNNAGVNIGGVS